MDERITLVVKVTGEVFDATLREPARRAGPVLSRARFVARGGQPPSLEKLNCSAEWKSLLKLVTARTENVEAECFGLRACRLEQRRLAEPGGRLDHRDASGFRPGEFLIPDQAHGLRAPARRSCSSLCCH